MENPKNCLTMKRLKGKNKEEKKEAGKSKVKEFKKKNRQEKAGRKNRNKKIQKKKFQDQPDRGFDEFPLGGYPVASFVRDAPSVRTKNEKRKKNRKNR